MFRFSCLSVSRSTFLYDFTLFHFGKHQLTTMHITHSALPLLLLAQYGLAAPLTEQPHTLESRQTVSLLPSSPSFFSPTHTLLETHSHPILQPVDPITCNILGERISDPVGTLDKLESHLITSQIAGVSDDEFAQLLRECIREQRKDRKPFDTFDGSGVRNNAVAAPAPAAGAGAGAGTTGGGGGGASTVCSTPT